MPEKLCDLSQVTVVSEGMDLHLSSSASYPVVSLLNHTTVLVSYLLRLEENSWVIHTQQGSDKWVPTPIFKYVSYCWIEK